MHTLKLPKSIATLLAAPLVCFFGHALAQSTSSNNINVKDYGVVYDGKTDSTTAMQNAFSAAQSYLTSGTPVTINLGTGTILISGTLSLNSANASATIQGAGSGTTNVIQRGTGDFIDAVDAPTTTVSFRNFSVTRNASSTGGGTALNLSSQTGGQTTGKATFEDLLIYPASGDGGFSIGISLHSQSNTSIHNTKIVGNYKGATDDGSSGLYIEGFSANSGYSLNIKIDNSTFQGQWAGIRMGDWVQGVFISNADILGNSVGVKWTPDQNTGTEYVSISNSHINTSDYGIQLSSTDGLVSNCYFLVLRQGSRAWHAIDATNIDNLSVVGNMFRTISGLSIGDIGIHYYGTAQWGNFSANTFDDFTTSIELDNSAWGTIGSNVYINDTNGIVDNAKSGNTKVVE